MAEYGMYKNSEGYADPTAYEGIRGMAKPGEIWTYKGREVFIVKNQGSHCNILQLGGYKKGSIEIAGRYAQPTMISYDFNDLLTECVDRVTAEEADAILEEVAEALQIKIFVEEEQSCCTDNSDLHRTIDGLKVTIREKEDEAQAMRGQLELMKNMYNELLAQFLKRA